MNKKEDIIDAWIIIEQLSEGSIKKDDKYLKALDSMENNWNQFFENFIFNQKKEMKISNEDSKRSGIVLYFGIFDFEEVIDILRKKGEFKKTNEDISKSEKFTVAVYFDDKLNIKEKKLFLSMSGYILEHGDLPKNFLEFEASFRENIKNKFNENFNKTISELFKKYNVSKDNFRYKFLKNIENEDVNLHSFFIDDLKAAKKINSENLNRYFNGFSGDRKNLDSKNDSKYFDENIFEKVVLKPNYYPLGRFPSKSDYALSFMQQCAVNLALNDENNIRSVNGPPGTGKTTLLKDIFADLVVQQALEISNLSNKEIEGSMTYYKKGKIGFLPESISSKNIVVASSNNGAVQNIVKELPKIKEISEEFQNQLNEVDYFKDISNNRTSIKEFEKNKEVACESLDEENWGVFSLEGGASNNIEKLLQTIKLIEEYFCDNYTPDTGIYQEFLNLYNEVKYERDKVERYSEKIYNLREVKSKYGHLINEFEKEKSEKQIHLRIIKKEAEEKKFEQIRERIEEELSDVSIKLKTLSNEKVQAEKKYKLINSQKPGFLGIKKMFYKSKVEQYIKDLNSVNELLNHISKREIDLLNKNSQLKSKKNDIDCEIKDSEKHIEDTKAEFEQWKISKENEIEKLKSKIKSLDDFKLQEVIKEIDFSVSYAELQKSNPWFNKDFRILQSKLFISALKVRKQFLSENVKNIAAAQNIWLRRKSYRNEVNGQKLILEAWQWINFIIPIISTTFASFGRMFKDLQENSIGNLFIDEAGQVLPQASVGAIFRSKKVMAVGDPSQIKPVLTLDSNVLSLLEREYKVSKKFISADASTQTIIDDTSQYGFQKNDEEWIGIPLWVHRRCNYPMFTISNRISYNHLMVQGKKEDEAKGKSEWLDCKGIANDKYVEKQGDLLKDIILKRMNENPSIKDDIYIISPFNNVAKQLALVLDEIKFTKRQNDKVTNIGTVHTFQGKEAKIVYFVLGADQTSEASAKWAVEKSNMMNVAATRAKEEFYVIGDKKLYAGLNCDVVNKTIDTIELYNK